MSRTRKDTDKAIRNLLRWANEPRWEAVRLEHSDRHFLPAADVLEMNPDQMLRHLYEAELHTMLVPAIHDDFVTQPLPDEDDRSIVELYIARRGWREGTAGRRYLNALSRSVASLYEILDVTPGRSCVVQDLIRGGKPVTVKEQSGTEQLVRRQRIIARVLDMGRHYEFGGGLLPLQPEVVPVLLEVIEDERDDFDDPDELARALGPTMISTWLADTVFQLTGAARPEMVNRDGEALQLTETRFRFDPAEANTIRELLDEAPEWDGDDQDRWAWLADEPDEHGEPPLDTMVDTRGYLVMQDGELVFSTNSMERTELGREQLLALLGDRVRAGFSQVKHPEDLAGEALPSEGNDDIPDDVRLQVMQQFMDQHYRKTLDDDIPALGNRSPRQAVRSKKGRAQVIEWLKDLEYHEERKARSTGEPAYDFGWMWEELGLDED